jgi:hypothetical protein
MEQVMYLYISKRKGEGIDCNTTTLNWILPLSVLLPIYLCLCSMSLEFPSSSSFLGAATSRRRRVSAHANKEEERWGFGGDDLQTCMGKEKRHEVDNVNVMVCSPFGQRWTMATKELAGVGEESSELGKMTELMSDSLDQAHHDVVLEEGNSMVASICTRSARFHQNSSLESSLEFSRCKVRRWFVGAGIIETGWGWQCWKQDTKKIIGNYLLPR